MGRRRHAKALSKVMKYVYPDKNSRRTSYQVFNKECSIRKAARLSSIYGVLDSYLPSSHRTSPPIQPTRSRHRGHQQRPTLSFHRPSAIILSDQHSDLEPAARKHHYGHVPEFLYDQDSGLSNTLKNSGRFYLFTTLLNC